jgi:hypothetical protein
MPRSKPGGIGKPCRPGNCWAPPTHCTSPSCRCGSTARSRCCLIALWAPLLARAQPREGRYGRIVAAALIYAIYFSLVGVGESWLSHGVVSAWVGLWWVHGLFLLFGLGLIAASLCQAARAFNDCGGMASRAQALMKILDRYLFRAVATATLVALLVLLLLELFLGLAGGTGKRGQGRLRLDDGSHPLSAADSATTAVRTVSHGAVGGWSVGHGGAGQRQ